MKVMFILMVLINTNSSFAEKSIPFCSMYYYKDAKKVAEAHGDYDKYKHCAVSCILALKCPDHEVMQVGIFKELLDVMGPGNAELKDLEADFTGVALVTSKKATTEKACVNLCHKSYPQNTCPLR